MQLDQARIVIRERNFGEILGLALQCCREKFGGLMLAALVGMTPFALLNWWLLHDQVSRIDYEDNSPGYWFMMLLLMAVEAPMATAPIARVARIGYNPAGFAPEEQAAIDKMRKVGLPVSEVGKSLVKRLRGDNVPTEEIAALLRSEGYRMRELAAVLTPSPEKRDGMLKDALEVIEAHFLFGLAYDATRGVMVLTGGVVEPGQTDRHQDVWEWSGDPAVPAVQVLDAPPA